MKKFLAFVTALVLCMSMGMGVFAADNYKADILAQMDAAATSLGVQDSQTYKNARASVAAYEGTITEEQYKAAVSEIASVKAQIEAEGVEAYAADSKKVEALATQVVAAAEKVGVKVTYSGNGVGTVAPAAGGSGSAATTPAPSGPIKQTGADFTWTILMILGAAAVLGCGVACTRRRNVAA